MKDIKMSKSKSLFFIFCVVVLSFFIFLSITGKKTSSDVVQRIGRVDDQADKAIADNTKKAPYLGQIQRSGPINMIVTGVMQGQIQGSITSAGREGEIRVFGVEHDIVSYYDSASGGITGRRQHKPLTITKSIDKSTPPLHTAFTMNENLTDVKLSFYWINGSGLEQCYYIIRLLNARIVEIKHLDTNQEEISFVYEKIIWTWVEDGITAEDDWESPVV